MVADPASTPLVKERRPIPKSWADASAALVAPEPVGVIVVAIPRLVLVALDLVGLGLLEKWAVL
jgi:hypothetical protein